MIIFQTLITVRQLYVETMELVSTFSTRQMKYATAPLGTSHHTAYMVIYLFLGCPKNLKLNIVIIRLSFLMMLE